MAREREDLSGGAAAHVDESGRSNQDSRLRPLFKPAIGLFHGSVAPHSNAQ